MDVVNFKVLVHKPKKIPRAAGGSRAAGTDFGFGVLLCPKLGKAFAAGCPRREHDRRSAAQPGCRLPPARSRRKPQSPFPSERARLCPSRCAGAWPTRWWAQRRRSPRSGGPATMHCGPGASTASRCRAGACGCCSSRAATGAPMRRSRGTWRPRKSHPRSAPSARVPALQAAAAPELAAARSPASLSCGRTRA